MIVEQAFLDALGADTDTKVSLATAQKLYAAGLRFLVRYLSLGAPNNADLDKLEVQDILAGGLALMAVQHTRVPGWTPSAALGSSDGSAAAHNAVVAGLPAGVTIWVDLEGISGAPADVEAYVKAWFTEVRGAGYDAGAYVGGGVGLDESQLYALPVDRYWRSFSEVPNVARRGYCMMQLYPTTTVGSISVDLDIIQKDYLGGLPRWLAAQPMQLATFASTLPPSTGFDGGVDGDV
jgi:hypothetical protein